MVKRPTQTKKAKQSQTTSGSEGVAGQAEWHHLDAKGKVLGRLATEAALLLQGKHRSDFQRHLVAPVYVVVTNTDEVVLTGRKEDQKQYRHYTGYPGGLRERTVREQRARDSRVIVSAAIEGMLPKNNLRSERMKHLKLYPTADQPHLPQLGQAATSK